MAYPSNVFFPFARQLTTVLGAIHQANVIHKDLNPHNILMGKGEEQIRIIDFGIASELPRERQGLNPSRRLEGSLAYLSPETNWAYEPGCGLPFGLLFTGCDLL